MTASRWNSTSGNLVLRIPRGLHARLAAEAKRNQTSINKLATQLLTQNLERAWLEEQVGNLSRQINSVWIRQEQERLKVPG